VSELEELEQKYQTVCLDRGTGETARETYRTEVRVGDEIMEFEIRSMSVMELDRLDIPEEFRDPESSTGLVDKVEGVSWEMLQNIRALQKCVYIPDTDVQPFEGHGKAERLLHAPHGEASWFQELVEAVEFVHSEQEKPPDGMATPKLNEIAQAAGELKEQATAHDELNPDDVSTIAERIESFAEYLAAGRRGPEGPEGKG